jgi:hypothetical protein
LMTMALRMVASVVWRCYQDCCCLPLGVRVNSSLVLAITP